MAENPFSTAKDPKWFESREKNPRVGIAISAFGPLPTPFVASLADIIRSAMFEGIVVDTMVDITKPLDRSRTICVKTLFKNEPDYIFFIDSDMVFPPNVLPDLMRQGRDIVTGIYCRKFAPFTPVLHMLDKGAKRYTRVLKYPRDRLFKIDACGCGCLLVKSRVFKEIEEPWFRMTANKSEDIFFCEKAAQAGFEVWADGKVECGHMPECMPIMPAQFWRRTDDLKKQLETLLQFGEDGGRRPLYGDYEGQTEELK